MWYILVLSHFNCCYKITIKCVEHTLKSLHMWPCKRVVCVCECVCLFVRAFLLENYLLEICHEGKSPGQQLCNVICCMCYLITTLFPMFVGALASNVCTYCLQKKIRSVKQSLFNTMTSSTLVNLHTNRCSHSGTNF